MVKWLVTVLLVLIVLAVVLPRFGARKIPGDLHIPVRGRMYYIPIASTLIFSGLVYLVSRIL